MWQVPHTSGLVIVVSCTGVMPSAFSIGFCLGLLERADQLVGGADQEAAGEGPGKAAMPPG